MDQSNFLQLAKWVTNSSDISTYLQLHPKQHWNWLEEKLESLESINCDENIQERSKQMPKIVIIVMFITPENWNSCQNFLELNAFNNLE